MFVPALVIRNVHFCNVNKNCVCLDDARMSDPDKVEAATLKRIASGTVEGLTVRSVFETEKNLLLAREKNLNKIKVIY